MVLDGNAVRSVDHWNAANADSRAHSTRRALASRRLLWVEVDPALASTAAQTIAIEKPTTAASMVKTGATLW